MALNLGYIEGTCDDGDVTVRIYYDATAPHSTGDEMRAQPLIDGPRGYCLDVSNTSGRKAAVSVGVGDTIRDVVVRKGNPVTTGPGRSRTAAEVAALGPGFTTRGDCDGFQIACD